MDEGVYMTHKDIKRHQTCLKINEKHISQTKAAQELNVSLRQMQRIYKRFKNYGLNGLISKKKGKKSNHQLDSLTKARVLELVTLELYSEFGPTYMCEKLKELHNIDISIETTRQLMIQAQVWSGKKKKSPIIHQQRKPRARRGELIQVDGSPHAWFEDRGDPCVLLVFIDDATGHTFGLFSEAETTIAYMITLHKYIMKNGVPLAIYSDKYSVFRVNQPNCLKKDCITQFGRALKELEIELICANSPQAKGRVERTNQTLQDRLVKELRLAQISTIEEANNFLKTYWEKHNKRFERHARCPEDCHRHLWNKEDLDKALCIKEKRKVSKNLEIQYKGTIYQIESDKKSKHLIKAEIEIWEDFKGEIISMNYNEKSLKYHKYEKQECIGLVVNSKEIDRFLKEKHERKVSPYHPWKQRQADAQKEVIGG